MILLNLKKVLVLGFLAAVAFEELTWAGAKSNYKPEFPPCSPMTEPTTDRDSNSLIPLPELDFCSKWNPEFAYNGHHCCAKPTHSSRRRRGRGRPSGTCSSQRTKGTYCSEITPEQEEYTQKAEQGQLGDILDLVMREKDLRGSQAYCSVNSGFLAWGRRLIPSRENRIILRSPDRCTEFGTDSMVGMLEWLGRQVALEYPAPQYAATHLVVGDIAAPRGGCLSGRGGRRGHLSHTTGQDADVSFLYARPGVSSPINFHKDFDAKVNWKVLKEIFTNPYACIKVIFLDKRLIKKLSKVAARDPDWIKYRRFIRHIPGHRNHFHVRVGDGPGMPGCVVDAKPELEQDDSGEEGDPTASLDEILDSSDQ